MAVIFRKHKGGVNDIWLYLNCGAFLLPLSRAPSPEPRAPSLEPWASSLKPQAPSLEPRSPSFESRASSPEPRAPSLEPRVPSPEPRAPSPEPRAPSPDPRASSPEELSRYVRAHEGFLCDKANVLGAVWKTIRTSLCKKFKDFPLFPLSEGCLHTERWF